MAEGLQTVITAVAGRPMLVNLLALGAALVLQSQSPPIGELSKQEFLDILTGLGYKVTASTTNPHEATITHGNKTILLFLGYSGSVAHQPIVATATYRLEYHVTRNVPKKWLSDWATTREFEGRVDSYLGGRVLIHGLLADTKTPYGQIPVTIRRLLKDGQVLEQELARFGARPATAKLQIPMAPLDLNFKLDWADPEDLDYLREELGWGKQVLPGGGRGWATGAEPLGIPIVFGGMSRVPFIFLTCMGKADPAKVDRYLKGNPRPITWAEASITRESVYIETRLDISKGITVRDLSNQILAFARNVKALDIY
jgi:hypothetical protein